MLIDRGRIDGGEREEERQLTRARETRSITGEFFYSWGCVCAIALVLLTQKRIVTRNNKHNRVSDVKGGCEWVGGGCDNVGGGGRGAEEEGGGQTVSDKRMKI